MFNLMLNPTNVDVFIVFYFSISSYPKQYFRRRTHLAHCLTWLISSNSILEILPSLSQSIPPLGVYSLVTQPEMAKSPSRDRKAS
jgi:hypothetical protein